MVPSMLYQLDSDAPLYTRETFSFHLQWRMTSCSGCCWLSQALAEIPCLAKVSLVRLCFIKWRGSGGIVQAIQDPKRRYEDTTLAAVAGAAVVVHLEPHGPGFESHARGLAQILSQRGGYESMRDNRLLHFYVTVNAIAISRA